MRGFPATARFLKRFLHLSDIPSDMHSKNKWAKHILNILVPVSGAIVSILIFVATLLVSLSAYCGPLKPTAEAQFTTDITLDPFGFAVVVSVALFITSFLSAYVTNGSVSAALPLAMAICHTQNSMTLAIFTIPSVLGLLCGYQFNNVLNSSYFTRESKSRRWGWFVVPRYLVVIVAFLSILFFLTEMEGFSIARCIYYASQLFLLTLPYTRSIWSFLDGNGSSKSEAALALE